MSNDGICAIKPEFIITNHVREISIDFVSEKDKKNLICDSNEIEGTGTNEATLEPMAASPFKKQRLSKKEKKKLKGQNKSRPAPFKTDREKQLCNSLIDVIENDPVEKKCNYDKCVFLHDPKEFLRNKPEDIGDFCYTYDRYGRCPRGITCRFGKCHTTEDGFNKINPDKYNSATVTAKHNNHELMTSLRKRTYDFSLSDKTIALDDSKKKLQTQDADSGVVTDEDIIKLRKCERKTIDWTDKLYLSPLTTVGNLPFRRICKEFGVDVTCGEMAMCVSLLRGVQPEWALVKKHESENLFGVQLCGNNPYTVTKTAQMLNEQTDIDFIDLNLGCPIDLVYKEGGGCGLLRRPHILGSIVRNVTNVISIPLTIKTRTGVYSHQNVAHQLIPKLKDWGASMITLHGRSREQRYTKQADWSYINECAALADPIPLFGNGDVLSYEDYKNIQDTYKNVKGVMIGRGALIKPWIFTEIKEQRLWDISSSERFDILKKFTHYGLEHWGSDTKGVENTRKFMLEWLSFLHRYIPVGLLEHPPQKINERPPTFRGRNELETLMASTSCTDWIKISEMLLGPVPEDFHFLPKHKANSYK